MFRGWYMEAGEEFMVESMGQNYYASENIAIGVELTVPEYY
ncbi:hypothetical protein A2U01_0074441, partial [Trifolium medium]|nr:hypothetical protein [Trifolium medium]